MAQKSTKRALIASVLAAVLCLTMFIGTTFAWFTDEVTSGKTPLASGNLDVEFEYGTVNADRSGFEEKWTDVKGTTKLFSENLWEPGHTEVAYLRVTNAGSLKIKYLLSLMFDEEEEKYNNVYGQPVKLSDFLKYKLITQETEPTPFATREAALEAAGEGEKLTPFDIEKTDMKKDQAHYYTLVIWMPSDTDNDANYKLTDLKKDNNNQPIKPTINLSVKLVATQCVGELDSFDEKYDTDAWKQMRHDMLVKQGYTSVESGNGIDNEMTKDKVRYVLKNDVTDETQINFRNSSGTINDAKEILIDFNGYTMKNSIGTRQSLAPYHLILEDGANDGGYSIDTEEQTTISSNTDKLFLTINSGRYTNRYSRDTYGAMLYFSDAAGVEINGGTFDGQKDRTLIYYQPGSTITINGGEFNSFGTGACLNLGEGRRNEKGSAIINGGTFKAGNKMFYINNSYNNKTLTISGGTFEVAEGGKLVEGSGVNASVLKICGGTFNVDPTEYVDTTKYDVTENNGWWTVTEK